MRRIKSIISVAGILLLLLAAAASWISVKNISGLRPADSYEDGGVYTFSPYQVLPVQVKNTGASGRDRRMNPTKTVYMVYYRATDGSGYQWSKRVPARESGQKIVEEGVNITRKVLNIPGENTYITVEPEQTAESYTARLRQRYFTVLYVSAGYVLLCLLLAWRSKRSKIKTTAVNS